MFPGCWGGPSAPHLPNDPFPNPPPSPPAQRLDRAAPIPRAEDTVPHTRVEWGAGCPRTGAGGEGGGFNNRERQGAAHPPPPCLSPPPGEGGVWGPGKPPSHAGAGEAPHDVFPTWGPLGGGGGGQGNGTVGGGGGAQKHSEAGLWTACGQRCVDSENSQTTPATTSTTPNTPTIGRR